VVKRKYEGPKRNSKRVSGYSVRKRLPDISKVSPLQNGNGFGDREREELGKWKLIELWAPTAASPWIIHFH